MLEATYFGDPEVSRSYLSCFINENDFCWQADYNIHFTKIQNIIESRFLFLLHIGKMILMNLTIKQNNLKLSLLL